MAIMRANVFRGIGDVGIEEVPRPKAGIGEAVVRVNAANQVGSPSRAAVEHCLAVTRDPGIHGGRGSGARNEGDPLAPGLQQV